MLVEQSNKPNEGIRVSRLPHLGAEQSTGREHGGQYVQTLASLGFNEVALTLRRPGTAIGMNLRKSGFVDVGQHHVACCSLFPEQFDFYSRLHEVSLVPFF